MILYIGRNTLSGVVQAARAHEVYGSDVRIVLINPTNDGRYVIVKRDLNIPTEEFDEIIISNVELSIYTDCKFDFIDSIITIFEDDFVTIDNIALNPHLTEFINKGTNDKFDYENYLPFLVYKNLIDRVASEYEISKTTKVVPYAKTLFLMEFINAVNSTVDTEQLNNINAGFEIHGIEGIAKTIATTKVTGESASYFDVIFLREKLKGLITELDDVIVVNGTGVNNDMEVLCQAALVAYEVALLDTGKSIDIFTDGDINANSLAAQLFNGRGDDKHATGKPYDKYEMLIDVNAYIELTMR